MTQRIHRTLPLVLALSTIACGAEMRPPAAPSQAMADRANTEPMAVPAPATPGASGASANEAGAHHAAAPSTGPTSASAPSTRAAKTEAPTAGKSVVQSMLIYTGALTTSVEATKGSAAVDEIVGIAESLGGHIAARSDGNVTVKVPSPRFREAMSAFERVGEVRSRHVTAQDVTEEFHDLEVRLQNLRATRKRLEEFLGRATNMQEALTVERELERVAQEMDRLEGRFHLLRDQSALSTISVSVLERPPVALPVVKDAPPPPPPPPPARLLDVPVSWISDLGISRLTKTR